MATAMHVARPIVRKLVRVPNGFIALHLFLIVRVAAGAEQRIERSEQPQAPSAEYS